MNPDILLVSNQTWGLRPRSRSSVLVQELRQLMATHGGNFEVYYSRQRVTHIICSNLPNAKIKALQKER